MLGKTNGQPKRKPLQVYLPAKMLQDLKIKAVKEDTTMQAIVEAALLKFLK